MKVTPTLALEELDTRALVNLFLNLRREIKQPVTAQGGDITPEDFVNTNIEIAKDYIQGIAEAAFRQGIEWQKKQ